MKNFALRLLQSKSLYFFIVTLCFLLFYLKIAQPELNQFVLTTPSGKSIELDALKFMESNETGIYSLKGNLVLKKYSDTNLRIIPDDEVLSILVNDQPIDLSEIPHDRLRDYNMGFTYELADYLQIGDNSIDITYSDQGGLMGIVIGAEPKGLALLFVYFLLALILLVVCMKAAKYGKFSSPMTIIFVGALLIRIVYLAVTPPDVRDHDLGDHFGYNEYLAQHWVPPPFEYAVGGAFFHPPLYYYTGALVYKATKLVEPHNKVAAYKTLQILSLVYSMGFVFFGLLILDRLLSLYKIDRPDEKFLQADPEINSETNYVQNTNESSNENPTEKDNASGFIGKVCERLSATSNLWIIGSLFAFWPSAIIHSVRIGNDPLLYFLFTASLYFILRWYQSDAKRDLLFASLIGAAAIITKANGEILVAVLGVIGLYKMIKTKEWLRYFKVAILPASIMLVAVAITVTPGIVLKMQGKRDKLYIDNIDGLSHANLVGNTAANYFWFDTKVFITEPYTDPYDDRMGRQFFWNYLAKTGLFGEFKYPSLLSINTAVICSFFFVLMFLFLLIGIYHLAKEDFKRSAPILLSGFFLWAGVTYMRMTFPANIDFRYILPIILTFCVLYGVSILRFERLGAIRLARTGQTLAALFIAFSIVFILSI